MKLTITLIVVCLSILFICLSGCSPKPGQDGMRSSFSVTYSKGKGYSSSRPQYSIEITNRTVEYRGIANVSAIGTRTFKISDSELKKIKNAFNQSNFLSFDELYMGSIRDLPLTTIVYNNHKVRYQEREIPGKLKELADLLDQLVPE